MRNLCTLPVSLSVLVCVLTCSAQAGTTVQCLENALPMETLGDDAEQRDLLLLQAETCARGRKTTSGGVFAKSVDQEEPN